ncbi:MAG: hypothetical protein K8L97_08190 [Anaerolineae bacterium]|nr:hypothetical protein [Anaerolineae bacterium]
MLRPCQLILLILCLAACNLSETPTPPGSTWGEIITLGQAEQMDAPDFWPGANNLTGTWIGADERGVHHDGRAVSASGFSELITMPLPPVHPYGQQLYPAGGDNLHLLWLDDNGAGETRLYGAVITATLEVVRGPTLLSEQATQRFTVLSNGDGTLWIISAGGLLSEPGLFARYLDAEGRPRLEDIYQIAADADWPTIIQGETPRLFWLRPSDGQVWSSPLLDGEPTAPAPVVESVILNPGDRLNQFSGGQDMTHTYLFWNITRMDGQNETWFSAGQLDNDWNRPARLGVDTALAADFATGFNTGTAQTAQAGEAVFSWAAPLNGQFETLPVAGVVDKNRLTVVYLRGGGIVGWQPLTSVTFLLGTPLLHTDRDRHLYLSWAEPTSAGTADLKVTSTRGF